jgi:hypothetical protein
VPQTGRAPGMIYRKSAAADSSVLSHPITWLDERIFGWSRSASSSVWGGSSKDRFRSEPPTAPGSPNDSDGEEFEADVDYDDVSSPCRFSSGTDGRSSQLWISDVMTLPRPEEAGAAVHTETERLREMSARHQAAQRVTVPKRPISHYRTITILRI